MARIKEMSTFQLVLFGVFGAAAVGAVIIFAMGGRSGQLSQTVTLELWGFLEEPIIDEWLEGNFDDDSLIKIKYTYVQKDRFNQRLWQAEALGKGPDIVLISQDQIKPNEELILTVPYDVFSERNFRDIFVQAADVFLNRSEGFVYGFPILVDPLVMYSNRSHVREAGHISAPTKWADFGDFVMDSVKRERNVIERYSVALGEYENIEHFKAIISTLIFQAGGQILSGDITKQETMIDEKMNQPIAPAISSLLFYTDFSDKGKSVYTWNRQADNSFKAFLDENLSVYFGMASDLKRIKETNPFLDFDVALVPENENGRSFSYSEVLGLSILKSSKKPSDAISAIYQLMSASSLENLSSRLDGFPPSRSDLISSPPQEFFYFPVLYEAGRKSMSWSDPSSGEIEEALKEMVESVVDRLLEADVAVKRAHSQIKSILIEL